MEILVEYYLILEVFEMFKKCLKGELIYCKLIR